MQAGTINQSELDAFTQGYIEAMMWTLTDEDGHSLDYLGLQDIAPETIATIKEDCARFQETYRSLLDRAYEEIPRRDDAHHGHDYWLTRNGHGCGFWDRGYSDELSEALTEAAKTEGEVYAYYAEETGQVHI